jgi:hypothetical protein
MLVDLGNDLRRHLQQISRDQQLGVTDWSRRLAFAAPGTIRTFLITLALQPGSGHNSVHATYSASNSGRRLLPCSQPRQCPQRGLSPGQRLHQLCPHPTR